MEIESTGLIVSLLTILLSLSIILSFFKLMSFQKSIRKYCESNESNCNLIRSKLAQLEFEIKDFRRSYNLQLIKDHKDELHRSRNYSPLVEGPYSKIESFSSSNRENNRGNVL